MARTSAELSPELHTLIAAVQLNCDIADAEYARDFSLCIYLLKMREHYRWEKGHGCAAELPGDDLGRWLQERERLWQSLESRALQPIPVDGSAFEPFDAQAINRALGPQGLVYSAGYGRSARPHFLLARLLRTDAREGCRVYLSDQEYARDMVAPPAMSQGRVIYVRRDALRRMLCEKIEEWRWRKADTPTARALAAYDLETDLEAALDAMTEREIETAILHEIGEVKAGELLGPAWETMLAEVAGSRAELVARAVRDHLADCLYTLPHLIERHDPASLHFYIGNLEGVRRELFGALVDAYRGWLAGDRACIAEAVRRGQGHWHEVGLRILDLHRRHRTECIRPIGALLESARLSAAAA
jgi:hypothetical protein